MLPRRSRATALSPSEGERRSHPYLSGNFAPIKQTLELTPCSFSGHIPAELGGGQYVRNGGNPLTNDELGREAHWFDGDGMLSGVLFRRAGEKGTDIVPEFVNQFVVTDVFLYAKNNPNLTLPLLPSIATLVNPFASLLAIMAAILRTVILALLSHLSNVRHAVKKISVANTAIMWHDGRALATCESGPPMRILLPSLETVGWFNGRAAENEPEADARPGFGGEGALAFMKEWTTGHPRVDPVTKELISFHSVFIKPYAYYSIVPATHNAKARPHAPAAFDVPVPGMRAPKMMHDFGVSRRHTIIMDLPLSLDPFNIVRGVPVVNYDPAEPARFGVFPRHTPQDIQWFETNPCVIFHTANAWDTVDKAGTTTVHLLACRLTSASLVYSAGALSAPQPTGAIPPEYAEEEQCRLYYYSFPLHATYHPNDRPRVRHQWALSAISTEFPTLHPARSMEDARFVYGCSTGAPSYSAALGKAAKIDFLSKFDVHELIRRGLACPPQQVKGCVDTRTVGEVLRANDPNDPIQLFAMPEGWYAQEPRFVARANAKAEDDGWLLTYVFNEAQLDRHGVCPPNAASELWIIDATSMKTVVARVALPQRVPYGLHGQWFAEEEILAQRAYSGLRRQKHHSAVSRARRGLVDKLIDAVESRIG